MALPVNIHDLVHGTTIEWERLECKEGWNPEVVIRSMCAFANDLHNWGGGYIIIGIAEHEGKPVLPPVGLQQNQLDAIQKKIVELGYKISPHYFPITQPYVLDGRHILVLWCPAGDNRVYTAPTTLANGDATQREPYVRVGASSMVARGETLRRLQELTARIPFDDRVNNRATLQDLDLGLIQAYLQEVRSELYEESRQLSFSDLCRAMRIARGADEDIRPVNAGLLFFSREPHLFFDRCWIELVWYLDATGTLFKEYYFKGPLHEQLREALNFLLTNLIGQMVVKLPDQAEAMRFHNFPFAAVEEALSNAIYHKSYEVGSPVEVQVWPDKIEILSHPGPVPPVNSKTLRTRERMVAREYRNRRIGDFLKELHLTEGRGTGLPGIYRAMADNGSPAPVFDTDDESFFLALLPIHSQFGNGVGNGANVLLFNNLKDILAFGNGAGNGAGNAAGRPAVDIIGEAVHERVAEMLTILQQRMPRAELFAQMGLSNQSRIRARYLDPLIEYGWVVLEYPGEKTHPGQRYQVTEAGKRILNLIDQQ